MKTRLRRLTIAGTLYQWSLNVRYAEETPTAAWMQVRIWGNDKARSPLLVEVLIPQRGSLYVLPAEVRQLIESGTAAGWHPHLRGDPYQLRAEDHQQAIAPILMRYPGHGM